MESVLFSHTVGSHLLKKLNKLIIFQKKGRTHKAQMGSLVNSTEHLLVNSTKYLRKKKQKTNQLSVVSSRK